MSFTTYDKAQNMAAHKLAILTVEFTTFVLAITFSCSIDMLQFAAYASLLHPNNSYGVIR